MKIYFIAFSLFLLAFTVHAVEITEIEALNGKVTIQAPKGFGPMSTEMRELKYPASRRPTEVLSDQTGGVTLAFNHTNNPILPSQIKEAHKSISKMFHNLHPSATWVRDEVIEQNGNIFMVLELITPALDTKIHNIIYGTSVDGRLLLAAFNTTVQQSDKWLPIGKEIMNSLSINQ